jgi:arylsulfatase A-like enzyme
MTITLRTGVCAILLIPALAIAQRPNVVLIITDDVGYADFGSYGARDVKTPNIDRLARQGVRMTDFYATPMCTPTRAMLITGRYQQRVGLERALGSAGPSLEQGLPATGRSLPQLLKNNGYATGLIGKWHLGYKSEFLPNAHGFDYFYGFLSGYVDFYTHTRGTDGAEDLWENTTAVRDSGYLTDLITARSVRFIEQNAGRPFFLEIAYNAAHWPFQRPDRPAKAAGHAAYQNPHDSVPPTRADYVAMIERADRGIGEVVAALEKRGLSRNTLVIFTNDNGGEWLSDNSPFFHRKQTLWEGGIRVPAIFRWPARLPAGKTVREPAIMMDVTASILAATGTAAPTERALEGRDILPVLAGAMRGEERMLFWRYFSPVRQHRAVRRGDWKLLLDGEHAMLFNLRTDAGERRDLARSRPDLVRQLRQAILDWEKDVDAEAAALKR